MIQTTQNGSQPSENDGQVVLPPGVIPGVEVRRFHGFISNEAHSHTTFDETYQVERGTIEIALKSHGSDYVKIRDYREGDLIAIPRGTSHRTLGGSSDNQILVSYYPEFIPADRVPDLDLERACSVATSAPEQDELSMDSLTDQIGQYRLLSRLEALRQEARSQDLERSKQAVADFAGW